MTGLKVFELVKFDNNLSLSRFLLCSYYVLPIRFLRFFFCPILSSEEAQYDISEILSYDFFNACDPDESEKETEGSRVGIWSISTQALEAGVDVEIALKLHRQKNNSSKLMFLIGVDCTAKPDVTLQSLQKWLVYVHKVAVSLSPAPVAPGEKLGSLLSALSVPMAVVVCKADCLQVPIPTLIC